MRLARAGDPDVDVVLVGGAGREFSYQALNRAFGHLQRGARLVAMHRGLYWRTSEGLQLDSGAFVAGLEQAAGTTAEVVGKPAPAFFTAALAHLGASAAGTLMVGDDVENDVLAASARGSPGCWSRPASTCPAPCAAPAAPPTTSWAPSPTCQHCWTSCRDRGNGRLIMVDGLSAGASRAGRRWASAVPRSWRRGFPALSGHGSRPAVARGW